MLKNYYDIFRVPKDAPIDEITRSYETLLEKMRARYGEEYFMQKRTILDKAYGVLSDPEKREKYDRMVEMQEPAVQRRPDPEIKNLRTAAENEPAAYVSEHREPKRKNMGRFHGGGTSVEKTDRPRIKGLVIAIVVVALLIAVGGYCLYNFVYVPSNSYRQAVALFEEGRYEDAAYAFNQLGDYGDSVQQAVTAQRAIGYNYVNNKNYDKALEIFAAVGTAEDIAACKKAQAEDLLSQQQYEQAMALFQEIGDGEGVNKCRYAQASALLLQGSNAEAYTAFKELGEYRDSAGKVVEIRNAVQQQAYAELGKIDSLHISVYSAGNIETAKQCVTSLATIESQAETFELDELIGIIEEKWEMIDENYYAVYFREVTSKQSHFSKDYFSDAGTTATTSTSRAEDEATVKFPKKPDYVSFYADCIEGASEKTLQVTWYKYALDRATGEFTQREQVAKSKEQALPEIRHSYKTVFGFKKGGFKYGAGLYAAEVTAEGDESPCALCYFYLQ